MALKLQALTRKGHTVLGVVCPGVKRLTQSDPLICRISFAMPPQLRRGYVSARIRRSDAATDV